LGQQLRQNDAINNTGNN